MKTLIFLIFMLAVVSVLVWRVRKNQAEEVQARHDAIERRKKQEKESLTPEMDMIWPVVVRPVKGDQESEADEKAAEPSMTSIDYEPPDKAVSK